MPTTTLTDVIEEECQDAEFKQHFQRELLINEIAKLILQLRQRATLTQKELAYKAKTTQPVIARLEKGSDSRVPSLELLTRIATAANAKLKLVNESPCQFLLNPHCGAPVCPPPGSTPPCVWPLRLMPSAMTSPFLTRRLPSTSAPLPPLTVIPPWPVIACVTCKAPPMLTGPLCFHCDARLCRVPLTSRCTSLFAWMYKSWVARNSTVPSLRTFSCAPFRCTSQNSPDGHGKGRSTAL